MSRVVPEEISDNEGGVSLGLHGKQGPVEHWG